VSAIFDEVQSLVVLTSSAKKSKIINMIDETLNYRLLDHTADLGFEITASGQTTLFKKAGFTLLHLMLGAVVPSGVTKTIKVSLSGDDPPDLMVRWLTEILYLLEGERLVVTDIKIDSITHTRINATLNVLPFEPLRHEILREIKAVTYHQIEVARKNGTWEARVILDL
jgi:SHS2 domain-containing protein